MVFERGVEMRLVKYLCGLVGFGFFVMPFFLMGILIGWIFSGVQLGYFLGKLGLDKFAEWNTQI